MNECKHGFDSLYDWLESIYNIQLSTCKYFVNNISFTYNLDNISYKIEFFANRDDDINTFSKNIFPKVIDNIVDHPSNIKFRYVL